MLTILRAWLQTADEAKKVQQTQCRLIFDNLSLPVSMQSKVYDAIIESWTSALKTLERLIQGTPQRIDTGAILLGLSAWHLYPDIILAGTDQYVKQADSLITPGGTVTIGLRSREGNGDGVFWSLPLTHARYYGESGLTTRYAGIGQSRVSFEEFMFVVVGSILGGWDLEDRTFETGLNLIDILDTSLQSWKPSESESLRHSKGRSRMGWLKLLGSAARQYTKSKDITRQQIGRLLSFGQRRCSTMLAPKKARVYSVFGLTDFRVLLAPFAESLSHESGPVLSFLRNLGCRVLDPNTARSAMIRYRLSSTQSFRFTRLAVSGLSVKRRRRNNNISQRSEDSFAESHWMNDQDDDLSDGEDGAREIMMPHAIGEAPTPHCFVCGVPGLAAIYLPSYIPQSTIGNNTLKVSQLISCIENGDLNHHQIANALAYVGTSASKSVYFDSLCAVEAAERTYSQLPGAKVDLQVTSLPLCSSKWWREFKKPNCQLLQATFSCIAYFETGSYDIEPSNIGNQAFAISHSSSIFVASQLLGDPHEASRHAPVERIVGNVGKPGLAILITPPHPKIRKLDFSSWHKIAHEPFDGSAQNNFQGTSFHLSFTGYELPLNINSRSGRDVLAYFLETTVSVYNHGEWVADLDILEAATLWTSQVKKYCDHRELPDFDFSSLVSIDSWSELLDPPVQSAVVRASGDPIARLATAALASRLAAKVIVLPSTSVCLACYFGAFDKVKTKAGSDGVDKIDKDEDDINKNLEEKDRNRVEDESNDNNSLISSRDGHGQQKKPRNPLAWIETENYFIDDMELATYAFNIDDTVDELQEEPKVSVPLVVYIY
ncbi:hypothetical protein BKA67DRAFT_569058 [Truncatella angustata]|uniref:Uncharacterized protein n=1 Tax=Truncatella angustata TaxID=152316 RepID=A0A9P8ZXQ8_9PEZI|nr:uncharacterized protein BKA67DRAFT_569058 [Truncatella angustata]KAH6653268.1 hypothetical protein BKA67DRAFT_569058 [Truncatella angustata]